MEEKIKSGEFGQVDFFKKIKFILLFYVKCPICKTKLNNKGL